MKPKRCKKCRKIICSKSISGYCSYCGGKQRTTDRRRKSCGICQEPCSGNMLIEHIKNKPISLCTHHFNKLEFIQDPKELRAKIKYLRSYH